MTNHLDAKERAEAPTVQWITGQQAGKTTALLRAILDRFPQAKTIRFEIYPTTVIADLKRRLGIAVRALEFYASVESRGVIIEEYDGQTAVFEGGDRSFDPVGKRAREALREIEGESPDA